MKTDEAGPAPPAEEKTKGVTSLCCTFHVMSTCGDETKLEDIRRIRYSIIAPAKTICCIFCLKETSIFTCENS